MQILRRIARRAMRHGYKLGQRQPFFYKLVPDLAREMGEAYPELVQSQSRIVAALKQEEERFAETLETGMQILDAALARDARRLDGETAFKLYDTYGFPIDLTADIGRERGFDIDMDGFNAAMTAQQERSRAASNAQSAALEAVSWITPPPVPPDLNRDGSPSMSTSQSSTWVSSSVQAGLVAHNMPCTPRPAESSSPRMEGPLALAGK